VDVSTASWLVIAVALAFANLPFVNDAVFGVVPYRGGRRKPFVLRLVELIVLYFIVGAIAYGLEARIGNVFMQTWEFYAITGCLFVVLAFPGFVVRYLRKQRS
jgi:p-aminobenzoyl-glutamate transporter AbgT